jgi:uncharacterized protein YjbI with pentapeptide repeats
MAGTSPDGNEAGKGQKIRRPRLEDIPEIPDTVAQNLDTVNELGEETARILEAARRGTQENLEEQEERGGLLDRLNSLVLGTGFFSPAHETGSGSASAHAEADPELSKETKKIVEETPPTAPEPPSPSHSFEPAAESATPQMASVPTELQREVEQLSKAERTRFCIDLLEDGKILEFNALRPAGAIDLSGIDLSYADLRGVDLRHANLSRAVLTSANLSGAFLQQARLDRADLNKTKLDHARLYRATLRYTDLSGVVSAEGAVFTEANLRGAELRKGNFTQAIFTGASLITANLLEGQFTAAHFEQARLAGATLTRATFRNANLHRAQLFQANGEDVDFRGCNLTGAGAMQSFFTSSHKKHADGHLIQTNFDGAWTRGFDHGGSISEEYFLRAISDRFPPEGAFLNAPAPDEGKVLINGIPGTDRVLYEAALEELNELIGLEQAKEEVRDYTNLVEASKTRARSFGLPEFDYNLHAVVLGPPGTGKSTVARILVRLNHSLGLLDKGHIVETDKSGFIAGYAGQSLGKTNETIDSSMGGGLIADEIYAMTESKNDDYAKDAMAVLIKRLWDDRGKFQALFLGYEDEMERFMSANPGMRRRIGAVIHCEAQTSGQRIDVMKLNLDKKVLRYSREYLAAASMLYEATSVKEGRDFGNAGAVVKSLERQALRMSTRLKEQNLMQSEEAHKTPYPDDLPFEEFTGRGINEFPQLESLSFVDEQGKEYSVKELPLEGPFRNLSERSKKLIREFMGGE